MKKATVFVVDDEEHIGELLTRFLVREGYEVHCFTEPKLALEAVDAFKPEVLVTDFMMPGLSGIDLIRRCRDKVPDLASIIITGYASLDNVVDALRSDVDDFITKPFSVGDIRDVVARALEGRPTTASPTRPVTAETKRPAVTTATLWPSHGDAASLAMRVRDILGQELTVGSILPSAMDALDDALGVTHGVLLLPAAQRASFHVVSYTAPQGSRFSDGVDGLAALSVVATTGISRPLERNEIAPLEALLDAGPAAAAPLLAGISGGQPVVAVLVVSRPADEPAFDDDNLAMLTTAADALGDVLRCVFAGERIEDAYVDSLSAVARTVLSRSRCFRNHAEQVRGIATDLGRRVGLGTQDLELLDMASRLSDLGRVSLPDGLLDKAEPPTDEEWMLLRGHGAVADDLIAPVGRLRLVKPVVRHVHENWDGSGHPDGLSGDKIPYLSSVIRIADAYAALVSERAWRPPLDEGAALAEIRSGAGIAFHPGLAAAFDDLHQDGLSGSGDAS